MKNLSLLILTALLFISCARQIDKNAEDYFLSALKHPFTEESNVAYLKLDSIIKHDTLARFILFKTQASHSIIIHKKNNFLFDGGDVRNYNIISLQCINDSLIILNQKDSIKFEMESDTLSKMILNPTDNPTLPHKKMISNECFENYPASKAIVIIEAQDLKFVKKKENSIKEWHSLMKQIYLVEDAYRIIRDKISLEKWNCPAKGLDQQKLECLIEIYPISVWVEFFKNEDFQ